MFDALTTERPYKDAWPVEEAVQFLKDQSGLHFEPRLVEHFLEILPDILKVRKKYSDLLEDAK